MTPKRAQRETRAFWALRSARLSGVVDEPVVQIRSLEPGDEVAYNTYLLEGVRRHPHFLRISVEDIERSPFSTQGNVDRVTLLAAEGEQWLGVGSLERELGRSKRRHIAWVMRMLVLSPGRGIGRLLLRELQLRGQAMPGVEKLNLTVVLENEAACHLYRSQGFVEFSREVDAFRYQGLGSTELSMSCRCGPLA